MDLAIPYGVLAKLLVELRNEIYDYVVVGVFPLCEPRDVYMNASDQDNISIVNQIDRHGKNKGGPCTILTVSKAISAEILALIHAEKTFIYRIEVRFFGPQHQPWPKKHYMVNIDSESIQDVYVEFLVSWGQSNEDFSSFFKPRGKNTMPLYLSSILLDLPEETIMFHYIHPRR